MEESEIEEVVGGVPLDSVKSWVSVGRPSSIPPEPERLPGTKLDPACHKAGLLITKTRGDL
jgi:hypothetical protein